MGRLKLVAALGILLSTSARADTTCPGWSSLPWGIGHALQLPSCYTFRVMAQKGMRLSDGTHFRGKNDLNAFVPDGAHPNRVYLLVNHEEAPGGAAC
jgi:secreted PhoX family phosphatase